LRIVWGSARFASLVIAVAYLGLKRRAQLARYAPLISQHIASSMFTGGAIVAQLHQWQHSPRPIGACWVRDLRRCGHEATEIAEENLPRIAGLSRLEP